MCNKKFVIIVAMAAILLSPKLCMSKDVILIMNSSINTSPPSSKDIFKIFMGRKIFWDDHTKIIVFFQRDPVVHNTFLKKYIHKSAAIFERLWHRQVFTGKVKSPDYLYDDLEMIEYVSKTRGAIGYVSVDADVDNVKTICVK